MASEEADRGHGMHEGYRRQLSVDCGLKKLPSSYEGPGPPKKTSKIKEKPLLTGNEVAIQSQSASNFVPGRSALFHKP